jgi:hypothetical protein
MSQVFTDSYDPAALGKITLEELSEGNLIEISLLIRKERRKRLPREKQCQKKDKRNRFSTCITMISSKGLLE